VGQAVQRTVEEAATDPTQTADDDGFEPLEDVTHQYAAWSPNLTLVTSSPPFAAQRRATQVSVVRQHRCIRPQPLSVSESKGPLAGRSSIGGGGVIRGRGREGINIRSLLTALRAGCQELCPSHDSCLFLPVLACSCLTDNTLLPKGTSNPA
jgi:hypothetical protein